MTSPLLLAEQGWRAASPVASLVGAHGSVGFPEVGDELLLDTFDGNLSAYSLSFGGWAIAGGKLTPGVATTDLMYATRGNVADHVVGTVISALPGGTAAVAGMLVRGTNTNAFRVGISGNGRLHVDVDASETPGFVTDPGFASAGSELRIYTLGEDVAIYVDGVLGWEGETARTDPGYGLYLAWGDAAARTVARWDHFQVWEPA